jgi:hypothetical protein
MVLVINIAELQAPIFVLHMAGDTALWVEMVLARQRY